jgi:hypothetical protein
MAHLRALVGIPLRLPYPTRTRSTSQLSGMALLSMLTGTHQLGRTRGDKW